MSITSVTLNNEGLTAIERRVLFVVTTLGWGGAESQVIALAAGMQARGWDVVVCALLERAERRDSLEGLGIPVHTLGMVRRVADPRAVWRLAKIIRAFRPSVVHAHMVHANLLARLTRLVTRIPVLISSAHTVDEGGLSRSVAYRLTDSLTDLTTNVSEAAVGRSVQNGSVPEHRIRRMPNGIDLTRFGRDPEARGTLRRDLGVEGRFVWLAVGRIEPAKDYPTLLNGWKSAQNHPARPVLLVVGDGPGREALEQLMLQMGIKGSVQYLGRRKDVPALMSAADGYVLSSAWEGLPMVLLEAAASGLPIVATKVGGNSEIVLPGETGELVPPKDSAALANAMVRTMDLPDEVRRKRGIAGTRHVREAFELQIVIQHWEKLYQELLTAKGASFVADRASG